MRNYLVSYHGKIYRVKAESAVDAISKVQNRPVFGNPLIPCRIRYGLVDADTRGRTWAEAVALWSDWTDGEKENRRIFAELDNGKEK